MRLPLQGAALVVGLVVGSAAGYLPDAVLASRNSSGTYSLPAGNPVVTGNTITSTWANTTLSDISTELTNSLDRGGRGAMTAPLQLSNGTVSLPSLTFGSDPDSGLYRIGANNVGLAVNGTKLVDYGASAVTVVGSITATGAAGAKGATLANGTAATGATRQDALALTNGDIDLSGVAYPTSTTSISERLTVGNIAKAWAKVTTTGGGSTTVTVNAGFNIASATASGANLDVVIAADMADNHYAAVVSPNTAGDLACNANQNGAGTVRIVCYDISAAGTFDFQAGVSEALSVIVYGAQ